MVPASTSHSPPFHVPIRYMLTGIVSFLVFAVLLLIAGVQSGTPSPAPLWVTTTHVLTLGALLSFAMGASYQLVTVAFLTPLASVRGAALNYWLYTAGLVGLWCSMARWWLAGLVLFGTLTVLAVSVYAVIILASMRRSTVLTVGDEEFEASPGDFLVFPTDTPHALANRSSQEAVLFVGAIYHQSEK